MPTPIASAPGRTRARPAWWLVALKFALSLVYAAGIGLVVYVITLANFPDAAPVVLALYVLLGAPTLPVTMVWRLYRRTSPTTGSDATGPVAVNRSAA